MRNCIAPCSPASLQHVKKREMQQEPLVSAWEAHAEVHHKLVRFEKAVREQLALGKVRE